MATAIDRDELIKTVETVQDRIKRYHDRLVQDEMVTRVALVDPILKVLGWDVANLDLVEVEHNYSAGGDQVDYALWNQPLLGGPSRAVTPRPAAFVEAKSLDRDLEYSLKTESHKRFKWQIDRYRYYTDYIVTTNGDLWRVYETAPADFNKCLLKELEFKMTKAEPSVCAGYLVRIASTLRSSGLGDNNLRWTSLSTVTQKSTDRTCDFPHQGSSRAQGWPSSAKFPPSAIQFPPTSINPNGRYEVTQWSELLEKTACWLEENKYLTRDKLPIRCFNSGPEGRHLIDTKASTTYTPIHDSGLFIWVGGNEFGKSSRDRKRKGKGSNKGERTSQKSNHLMNAAHLLTKCGQNPQNVYIQAPP